MQTLHSRALTSAARSAVLRTETQPRADGIVPAVQPAFARPSDVALFGIDTNGQSSVEASPVAAVTDSSGHGAREREASTLSEQISLDADLEIRPVDL